MIIDFISHYTPVVSEIMFFRIYNWKLLYLVGEVVFII